MLIQMNRNLFESFNEILLLLQMNGRGVNIFLVISCNNRMDAVDERYHNLTKKKI